ncbi:MAG: alpha/beta fold hydrolase [Elusimicrobia bacterium]|nr:alpha/beta fold hydrolase [Elusimicrobiota bacterium]
MKLLQLFLGIGSLLLTALSCAGSEHSVKSFDGFPLRARLDINAAASEDSVERVVVLIHGSGPQSLDEDLSSVSAPGTTNYFFADLAAALNGRGIAVVRYDKRSYAAARMIAADRNFAASKKFKRYAADPLRYFIEDARHFTRWTARRFPRARVFLVGHSEGANVALQVARFFVNWISTATRP